MINEDTLLERRELLTKGLLAGAATLGVGGALVANTTGRLPVDVSVVNTADPLRIQRVSQLDVKLVNNGSQPVTPSFSVIREDRLTRFYWDITTDGKQTISPGETKQYHLHATNPGMAIKYDETYVVIVENEEGNQGATIENRTRSEVELVPVRNPLINSWLVSIEKSTWIPFRWDVSTLSTSSDSVDITKTDRGGRFSVTRGDRSGPWTMAGLAQHVPFIGSLKMTAVPGTLTLPSMVMSGSVCGLEVIDRSHRVWAVYADVAERQQKYYPGDPDYHIEYIPATSGQQTRFDLDLIQIYERRRWDRPPARSITIDGVQYQASTMKLRPFAAAYSSGNSTTMELIDIIV